jgi:thioredoxin-related protein
MSTIRENISKAFSKMSFMWYVLLIIGLLIIVYYIYTKYVNSSTNEKDIPNYLHSKEKMSNEDTVATTHAKVMMFTVDWCPHCKKAKEPWEDFKNSHQNKIVKGTRINCIEYNMTEKKPGEEGYEDYIVAKATGDKYEVDGFPTLKMEKEDNVIDFDAKITTTALQEFLENML